MSYARHTDQELLARLRAGEERAFDALYARYRKPLLRYAERILAGRSGAAEDLVQDAFLRAHAAILRSDRDIVVGAWLHRIVLNACLDELRRPRLVVTAPELMETAPARDDAHAVVARRESLREVVQDVVALPDRQREALVRVVLDGGSHADAAVSRVASVSASKSLVGRARTRLAHAREARRQADPRALAAA